MKTKKIVRLSALLMLIVLSLTVLFGCEEAGIVTRNLQKGADNFEVYRRVTVINLRSDKVLLEVEGYLSIQDTATSEIGVTIKIAPNTYKLHYVHTSNDCVYIVEQLENYTTDPYHWRIIIFAVYPDIDFE